MAVSSPLAISSASISPPKTRSKPSPLKTLFVRAFRHTPPQIGTPVPSSFVKAFQKAQDFLLHMLNTPPHDSRPFKKRLQAILQATPLASLRGAKWHHLLDYERLHLLALLQGSVIFDSVVDQYRVVSPAPLLAYQYLHLIHFFYTPLIEATKQGLSPSVYLHELKKSARNATYPCTQEELCTRPDNTPWSPWLEDFRSAKLGSWLVDRYEDTPNFSNLPYDVPSVMWTMNVWGRKQTNLINKDLAKRWTPKQARLWDLHYKRRIEAFFTNKDFYIDTLLNPEKISADRLRANPTPCFTPKYLNQQSVQNCQLILEKQRFDQSKIRAYLKSMRLLSVDGSPCLYLHSKEQLRGFNSKNPLCQALQIRPPNFSPNHILKRTFFKR